MSRIKSVYPAGGMHKDGFSSRIFLGYFGLAGKDGNDFFANGRQKKDFRFKRSLCRKALIAEGKNIRSGSGNQNVRPVKSIQQTDIVFFRFIIGKGA